MGTVRLLQALLAVTLIFSAVACFTNEDNEAAVSCPRIVKRSEWKARKPRGTEPLAYAPAPYVVVHHGGIPSYCHDQPGCAEIVRSYQNLHLDERGWDDIGYSFLIGEDGNVYEGRGWDRTGAHAPKYNNQSIGICLIGDFSDRLPNNAALKALTDLIDCGLGLGKIQREYRLIGHRQVRNTVCPGETLYSYLKRMPHWTGYPVPHTNATYSNKA